MSSLKMNAGLQGQMGTKRLLHIWQTGKCMTNMLSCDNQSKCIIIIKHAIIKQINVGQTCNHVIIRSKCITNIKQAIIRQTGNHSIIFTFTK